MAALTNAALYYESGVTQHGYAAMTDSGDHTEFTLTNTPWSKNGANAYTVTPYGLATGGEAFPESSGANDQIDVTAATAYMPGATGASPTTGLLDVAAGYDISITRGGAGEEYMINSLTINSSGAYEVVAAASGHPSAHSETRGAAGGPPFIPVGSIEVRQIRTTASGAAPITSDEIYGAPGSSQERYDYPGFEAYPMEGKVVFDSALPLIHTGGVPKSVRARVAVPIYSKMSFVKDFVPAEIAGSLSSDPFYGNKAQVSETTSYSAATWVGGLDNGISDPIIKKEGQVLLFKFYPDANRTAHILTQGPLRFARTNPVGKHPTATFTVIAERPSVGFDS